MDGRNRVVIYLPSELDWLIKRAQNVNRMGTKSAQIVRLLETHPELVRMAEKMYSGNGTRPTTEREEQGP